jgi:hypothetical protein
MTPAWLAWLAFALAALVAWEVVRLARAVSRRGAVRSGDVQALALLTVSGIALLAAAGWLLAAKPDAAWPASSSPAGGARCTRPPATRRRSRG